MALSTTIMRLQERARARDVRGTEIDHDGIVGGWRRDIEQVYAVIRAAMKPYVEDGSAIIEEDDVETEEELLGTNTYRRLTIAIVDRRIFVTPIARIAAGDTSRIDMYRENRPSEDHRVFIMRGIMAPNLDPTQWLIEWKGEFLTRPPDAFNGFAGRSRRYLPLASPAIENAVEFLLTLP